MTFTRGSTTLTLDGAIYPFELNFEHHQNVGIAEDCTARVYDRSITEKFIAIKFKDYQANLTNIRNFVTTEAVFSKNTFTFTPDSGVDAGAGAGVAVTVRYWTEKFRERMVSWQKYDYDMILRVEI